MFDSLIAGSSQIGGSGTSAVFHNSAFTTWNDSAMIQWNTGQTLINAKLGREIEFRNNGSSQIGKFDTGGDFCIQRNGSIQKVNDLKSKRVSPCKRVYQCKIVYQHHEKIARSLRSFW